ncbi:MAG: DUF5672 family protein [Runella sp.]
MLPVAVVIPFYKTTLNRYEQIALAQGLQVLEKYPIVAIKPKSLDITPILEQSPHLEVENFEDDYFESVQSYNRLMLSQTFYERFLAFEYILIYQLDAFVFRDELAQWCAKGYDYIGAPWRIEREFSSWGDRIMFHIKKKIALWFDLRDERLNNQPRDVILKMSVGNGGLSLRKVQKMLTIVKQHPKQIAHYLNQKGALWNEDIFFCIEMNRYFSKVKVPHWREALRFSVEDLPSKAYRLNGQQLPFGCHAWEIHELDFWKPHIEAFGHQLP